MISNVRNNGRKRLLQQFSGGTPGLFQMAYVATSPYVVKYGGFDEIKPAHIGSLIIPANYLKKGNVLRVSLSGNYTFSGLCDLMIQGWLGANFLTTSQMIDANTRIGEVRFWSVELLIVVRDVVAGSASVGGSGAFVVDTYDGNVSAYRAVSNLSYVNNMDVDATVDLPLKIQASVNNVGATMIVDTYMVEVLNSITPLIS